MTALMLSVVLYGAAVIVGLGTVYGVVVLLARSVVPHDRRQAQSGLTRPARGAAQAAFDRKARGGTDDPSNEH